MDAATYRVGTASWTDPTLLASGFYPPGCSSAEARLRFYAERFDTVEVDSTYYALPSEHNAALWAARTPGDFRFNIKAFAWLTRHEAETRSLPQAVRARLSDAQLLQARLAVPSRDLLELAFTMFLSALEPLRAAGKLGCLLFQFPPWFTAADTNREYILRCRDLCRNHQLAVELRHPSWSKDERTFTFLARHGLSYVSIDAPRAPGIPPSLCRATTDVAYVRFHGRNRDAWFRPSRSAADRFKYFYPESELLAWAPRIRALGAKATYVLFNNCYADYGVRNAATMRGLLQPPGESARA